MKMQSFLSRTAAVVAAFFVIPAAYAQLAMKIEVSQTNFLQNEPVFLRLGIRNITAHPIAFGETQGLNGEVKFLIKAIDGKKEYAKLIDDKIEPPITGNIIAPGGVKVLTFNLSKYYDLRNIGRYSVKAVISHPQLTAQYESNSDCFNIVPGAKIWETSVGVPVYTGNLSDKKIETRNYRIVAYDTGKTSVYALVIDNDEKVFLTRRIAYNLGSNLKPQCEVDFLSRLNIMVAGSPKIFAYYQYNVDGKLEKKQVFVKTTTTPTLVYDEKTGAVMTTGGREARKDMDYEEIRDIPFFEDMSSGELGTTGETGIDDED